ncbi:MAG: 2-hydroxyacyl-CoA dehydratase family protein [Candidatus Methanomethyliaceae archaeon]
MVGSYCVFVPEELVLAVDGISVGLCAGAEFNFEAAEEVLPRTICPLIKSAFGSKLGHVCPYIEVSDLVVGENTCDGKKKAYEILSSLVKDLYVIDLPQTKSDAAKMLLKSEHLKFCSKLEEITRYKSYFDRLKNAIDLVNVKKEGLKAFMGAFCTLVKCASPFLTLCSKRPMEKVGWFSCPRRAET